MQFLQIRFKNIGPKQKYNFSVFLSKKNVTFELKNIRYAPIFHHVSKPESYDSF